MTREEFPERAQQFLHCLQELGNHATNPELRDALAKVDPFFSNEANYDAARFALRALGVVELGRGQGGVIQRVPEVNFEQAFTNMEDRAKKLLRHVPENGFPIAEEKLRTRLIDRDEQFWSDDQNYYSVCGYLVALDSLKKGPGQKKTVMRVNAIPLEQLPQETRGRVDALLKSVPEDGAGIGNRALRRTLENNDPGFWGDEGNYFEVRDYLVMQGTLLLGPGHGGTVMQSIVAGAGQEPNRAEQLLRRVPEDGGWITNRALRETLQEDDRWWADPDNYFEVRDNLIESGVLELGRGQGGRVRRIIGLADEEPPEEIKRRAEEMMRAVPQDGSWIDASDLQHDLMKEDQYFWRTEDNFSKVRDFLIEQDRLRINAEDNLLRRAPKEIDPSFRAEELLRHIPEGGGYIGNLSLRDSLQRHDVGYWSDPDYFWTVRNWLVNRGQLILGQGRGGSVARVVKEPQPQSAPVEGQDEDKARHENQLYEGVLKVISKDWQGDQGYTDASARITAHARRRFNGKWSCPDISFLGLVDLPDLNSCIIDVVTFEVKRSDMADVTAVYESLEHRTSANLAYLVVVYEDEPPAEDPQLDEVVRAAREHGIGLIVCSSKNSDYDSWDERVPAMRHAPDPRRVNSFLQRAFDEQDRTKLRVWGRDRHRH